MSADLDPIPEELESVWDERVAEAFGSLPPNRQSFLLEYIRLNFNGTQAYRKVYNKEADDNTAASSASAILRNVKVRAVLESLKDSRIEDLFLVKKTLIEAAEQAYKPVFSKDSQGQPELVQEVPDYGVRVRAAEALAKLHGLNQAEKHEVSVTVSIAEQIKAAFGE